MEAEPNYYLIILPRRKTIFNPPYGFIKDYKDPKKVIFYFSYFSEIMVTNTCGRNVIRKFQFLSICFFKFKISLTNFVFIEDFLSI